MVNQRKETTQMRAFRCVPLLLTVIAWCTASLGQTQGRILTKAQWHEDLEFLATELPKRHANAFHFTSREQFESQVADLGQKLDQMNSDEIYVGMDRIVNSIGDGHTRLHLPADSAKFPINIARFGDDYHIVSVQPGNEKALGARVIAIDDTPIMRVHDLLLPLTPGDETTALRESRLADLLTVGMVLHGSGIISNRNTGTYVLADENGNEFRVSVHSTESVDDSGTKWIYAVQDHPLYREKPDDTFWYTYLVGSRTVYCSFRGYQELRQRSKGLFQLIRQQHPDKLVIDMRMNGGGDYDKGLKYLVHPIRKIPEINRKGHLFVLIGPSTFSAAMSNAAHFRYQTNAVLVGHQIGEKPNSYQEGRGMILPNSHWSVRYSVKFYQFVKSGENVIRPDKEIIPSWTDYRSGRDPVLDWVLAYKS